MPADRTAAESASPSAAEITCRFLKLAAELKNLIYEECFRGSIADCGQRKTGAAALLLTCKTINKEAKCLYYSTVEYQGESVNEVAQRIQKICPKNSKHIKHIVLDVTGTQAPRNFSLLTTTAFIDACMAQHKALQLAQRMRKQGLKPQVKTKFALAIADGKPRIATSESPFNTYSTALKSRIAQDPAALNLPQLLSQIDNQLRFFDFEHRRPDGCWLFGWHKGQEHKCNCAKKAGNDTTAS